MDRGVKCSVLQHYSTWSCSSSSQWPAKCGRMTQPDSMHPDSPPVSPQKMHVKWLMIIPDENFILQSIIYRHRKPANLWLLSPGGSRRVFVPAYSTRRLKFYFLRRYHENESEVGPGFCSCNIRKLCQRCIFRFPCDVAIRRICSSVTWFVAAQAHMVRVVSVSRGGCLWFPAKTVNKMS